MKDISTRKNIGKTITNRKEKKKKPSYKNNNNNNNKKTIQVGRINI